MGRRATYRVQLRPEFGFDEAAELLDYLADLGISHLYTSPCLQPRPGSAHGYDVVDPTRVNAELGGEAGHERLREALSRHGLGRLLDIVPNHMAIGAENRWWWDVLENGPSSRYAYHFDVDWAPPDSAADNRILIPVLGDHYGRVLEAGELTLARTGGRFMLCYYEHRFPVAPRSLDEILSIAARRAGSDTLGFIADSLARLPLSTATDRPSVDRRHRDKEILVAQLERLFEDQPAVAEVVDALIDEWDDDPDRLDVLIEHQNYRVAHWRTAGRELGYRRFFDVHELVGLRPDDDTVFDDTHALVLSWLREGYADGLRVDHPDGIRDPEHYLRRLRDESPEGTWLLVEKILEPGEHLPETWPVEGTTGYDFLSLVTRVLVDPSAEQALTELYVTQTGEEADWEALVREKKKLVMRESLGSELNRLTNLLMDVCEHHRRHRDYTWHDLSQALREVIACFPVYRTYMRVGGEVTVRDERYVQEAIGAARDLRPDLDPLLFAFLEDLLLRRVGGDREAELAFRFQQVTGAVMAKGVEDTSFYCFNRFVVLNEVGNAPDEFGMRPADFHRAMVEAQRDRPEAMLSTSTHDTKRSEDVRARLAVLSEIPERWSQMVRGWMQRNVRHRVATPTGELAPDPNTEYLLYQTLVGAWPIEVDRVTAYLEKATREAKVHTTWTQQNEPWEAGTGAFVEALYEDRDFVGELASFVDEIRHAGRINSFAQTLLKLTAPGVPDIYQGCELWDLSLVDPDNRRPVDFDARRRMLASLEGASPEVVLEGMDEGLPKLWVLHQALRLRARRPDDLAGEASYEPLETAGHRAGALLGFLRAGRVATVVPCRGLAATQGWGDTELTLPDGNWRNVLTGGDVSGGRVPAATLFARFPVALLERPP